MGPDGRSLKRAQMGGRVPCSNAAQLCKIDQTSAAEATYLNVPLLLCSRGIGDCMPFTGMMERSQWSYVSVYTGPGPFLQDGDRISSTKTRSSTVFSRPLSRVRQKLRRQGVTSSSSQQRYCQPVPGWSAFDPAGGMLDALLFFPNFKLATQGRPSGRPATFSAHNKTLQFFSWYINSDLKKPQHTT
jgi:hypothetical protein